MKTELYTDNMQTFTKHYILKHYLRNFAYIIGRGYDCISYIDAFSGPWESKDLENFSDTSFGLANEELIAAKKGLNDSHQRSISLRAFYVEIIKNSFELLQSHNEKFKNDFSDIQTRNGEFEKFIPEIKNWINKNRNNFTLLFIDPTGWTGFSLDEMKPVLNVEPSEVIINFMVKDIKRFASDQTKKESYDKLFAHENSAEKILDLSTKFSGNELDEKIADFYCASLKTNSSFNFIVPSPIFNPNKDTIHFYLIFCTRNLAGLVEFKKQEKKVFEEQIKGKLNTLLKNKESRDMMQDSLFKVKGEDVGTESYILEIKEYYLRKFKSEIKIYLQVQKEIQYRQLKEKFLQRILIWENDIYEFLDTLRKEKVIIIPEMDNTRKKKPEDHYSIKVNKK